MTKEQTKEEGLIALSGEVLDGKFLVGELLGEGGMSRVHRGLHLALQVPVAVKFLRGELTENPEYLERFLREARMAAGIKSEHSTHLYDVASTPDGQPYMVMELLDGVDLGHAIETSGALPFRTAVDIMLQVLEVLAEAHAAGLVHRDIKPANILVRGLPEQPFAKLLDFGVAVSTATRDTGRLTGANQVLGSPAYMSPEQLREAARADERSDVWSCGATMFELLCGEIPFTAQNIPALCAAIMTERPKDLRTLRGDIPPGLAEVVMQCLEKNPSQRPASARALARMLAPYASARGRANVQVESKDAIAITPSMTAARPWALGIAGVVLVAGLLGVKYRWGGEGTASSASASASVALPASVQNAPTSLATTMPIATNTTTQNGPEAPSASSPQPSTPSRSTPSTPSTLSVESVRDAGPLGRVRPAPSAPKRIRQTAEIELLP